MKANSLILLAAAILLSSTAHADAWTWNDIGRALGLGWSDGYHANHGCVTNNCEPATPHGFHAPPTATPTPAAAANFPRHTVRLPRPGVYRPTTPRPYQR